MINHSVTQKYNEATGEMLILLHYVLMEGNVMRESNEDVVILLHYIPSHQSLQTDGYILTAVVGDNLSDEPTFEPQICMCRSFTAATCCEFDALPLQDIYSQAWPRHRLP